MNLTKTLALAFCLAFGTALANAGTITYTCDPSVAASTCNYLNTTVASHYSSTFTNASASIYITYGTTGLAETIAYLNFVTYDQYVTALASNPSQSPVQVSALSALSTYDVTPYGSGQVEVTGALGTLLGFTGMTGIESDGSTACNLGSAGCYNAYIIVTNDPGTPLYYDDIGGPEPADAYDYYGTVEHETDEVLGASSCVGTSGINPEGLVARGLVRTVHNAARFASPDAGKLADGCGAGIPSAVDLFRYSSAGNLVLDKSLSTKRGAYFSYDGGTTNGADGIAGTPKVYNTLANGDDYADFVSSSPDCGTDIAVQDAEGCPGEDKGLTILNDGGGEINILNAVGYVLAGATSPGLTASPANLSFPNLVVGTTYTKKVLVENNSASKVVIGTASITTTGGDASAFSVHEYCNPRTLKSGKECVIAVTFKPEDATLDTATLNIPSNAAGSPLEVPLSGTGVNKK